MTVFNFVYEERYPDSLERFYKRALEDYIKKDNSYSLVLNHTDGDVILDIKCRFVEQVQKMSGLKVLYFPDNLYRFGKLFNRYERYYDIVFFAHKNAKIDNKRYFYLPVAYDPYTHYPLSKKKTIDVAFIGTAHEGRAHIKRIKSIHIYGNGWGDAIYPVYGAKKRSIYAQTRIMVNHHVAGDTSPNMRDYEALAMRAFLLSDFLPKELEGGMVKYDSFDDLLAKTDYYMDNEEERERITRKGKELVNPYTYEKRCEEMMEVIKNAQLG